MVAKNVLHIRVGDFTPSKVSFVIEAKLIALSQCKLPDDIHGVF